MGYGAYRGIRRIRRARRRHRQARKLGHPRKKIAKSRIVQNQVTTRDTLVAYFQNLTSIPRGEATDEREHNSINFSGFSVKFAVRNELDKPQTFCWALLSPKSHTDEDDPPTTFLNELFRDHGAGRARAFGAPLSSLELTTLPFNTDKWVVLRRGTTHLAPKHGEDHQTGGTKSSYKRISFYHKFGRQLRFDSTTETDPEQDRVYLLTWSDVICRASGIDKTLAAYCFEEYIVTYFRDGR